MDKFYVIKVINNRTGSRGWICYVEGKLMVSDKITASINQFETEKEAQHFVKEHKLDRKGMRAYIRDNEDLINNGNVGTRLSNDSILYTCMNLQGHYVFYDVKKETYYFDNRDTGYCIWNDKKSIDEFISVMDFPYDVLVKEIKNEKH